MSDPNPNVPLSTGFIDRVKGKAKEIFGSFTGDDDLVDEGRLHEQKADAERTAQKEAAAATQAAA
ncbi:MAG: CsbD family protein, partial [Actinobacteria bacterium]